MSFRLCEHGFGGFFTCRHGCHLDDTQKVIENVDRNLDYFYNRLEAHGLSMGPPDRTVKKDTDS